jgi:hypothetical protein
VVEWLKYAVRMFAAVILIGFAAVMLILAVADPKIRTFGAGVAVVFGLAGLFTWPRRPNAWRRDPPTERQVAYALDLGIRVHPGMSKGELSDLISQAKAIRNAE